MGGSGGRGTTPAQTKFCRRCRVASTSSGCTKDDVGTVSTSIASDAALGFSVLVVGAVSPGSVLEDPIDNLIRFLTGTDDTTGEESTTSASAAVSISMADPLLLAISLALTPVADNHNPASSSD